MTTGPTGASPPDLSTTASGGATPEGAQDFEDHEFRPTGTVFILAMFVLTLILLWLSVYVILLSRGVTT